MTARSCSSAWRRNKKFAKPRMAPPAPVPSLRRMVFGNAWREPWAKESPSMTSNGRREARKALALTSGGGRARRAAWGCGECRQRLGLRSNGSGLIIRARCGRWVLLRLRPAHRRAQRERQVAPRVCAVRGPVVLGRLLECRAFSSHSVRWERSASKPCAHAGAE
jgi:hypothetical protein